MVVFPRYLPTTKIFFIQINKRKKIIFHSFDIFFFVHVTLFLTQNEHSCFIPPTPNKIGRISKWCVEHLYSVFFFYLRQKSKEINIFLGVLCMVSFRIIKLAWCVFGWHTEFSYRGNKFFFLYFNQIDWGIDK